MGILLFPTLAVLCPEKPASRHRDIAAGASPAAYNFSFLSEILLTSGSAGPALSACLAHTPSGNCPVNAFPFGNRAVPRTPSQHGRGCCSTSCCESMCQTPQPFFFFLNSHRLSLHDTVTEGCLVHTSFMYQFICACLYTLVHGQPFHLHLFYSSTAGLLGFFLLNHLLSQTLHFQKSATPAFIRVCGQQVHVPVLLQTTSYLGVEPQGCPSSLEVDMPKRKKIKMHELDVKKQ